MVTERRNIPWARKHDLPGTPLISGARRVVYPTTLSDLIDVCRDRGRGERLHAVGSHWALSTAAVSDDTFIETNDPNDVENAMSRTFYDVVPGCLSPDFIGWLKRKTIPRFNQTVVVNEGLYPVHMEAGKRVYQAYCELDYGDDENPASLARLLADDPHNNKSYLGPWAFRTLGNSGGQTVFGALTTGTHGGDFKDGPIADGVIAIHLVTDGGNHYWIERRAEAGAPPMTEDRLLEALCGGGRLGGSRTFHIKRDERLFDAVLVNPGRFGVVYSFVYGAVRQYTLRQERVLENFEDVRDLIEVATSRLYEQGAVDKQGVLVPDTSAQRFLQIAVCITTHKNFTQNLVGVTRRWNALAAGTGEPAGRAERCGTLPAHPADPIDPRTSSPLFTKAGLSFAYLPHDSVEGQAADPSLLDQACESSHFFLGVLEEVAEEIAAFLEDNGVAIGGTMAAVAIIAGVSTLVAFLAALAALLLILLAIIAALKQNAPRLGAAMNFAKDTLLGQTDPLMRAAGVFIWHCIAYGAFSGQQSKQMYAAISYAVMEGHNYRDHSCNVNVESVEVFFNAESDRLPAFVDALIEFERNQNYAGKAFVGFASLRFTGESRATIAPERWPVTCAVEVAGLADVTGTTELVAYAERLALDPNYGAILHWGQRHNGTRQHIQRTFGDAPPDPGGRLGEWRDQLASLTANGRLDGFSNAFTRQTGLEVVRPRVGTLEVAATAYTPGSTVTVKWNCTDNPRGAVAEVDVTAPDGVTTQYGAVRLFGEVRVVGGIPGDYDVALQLTLDDAGERRTETRHTGFRIV